jgi:hypothetical protein
MIKKRVRVLLVTLTIYLVPSSAHAQVCFACAACHVLIDHGVHIYSCGSGSQGAPGPCSCNLTATWCVPCGCCQYEPGWGGVCYDNTGGQCGLEGCQQGTIKVGMKEVSETAEPNATGKASSKEELLESSPWLTDAAFQQKIESLAPEMGLLVKRYQDGFRDDWKTVHYRERRTIAGKVLLGNVSFDFSAIKTGHNWRLELSPDPEDPDSHQFGQEVGNALEILGRDWKLIHHIHGVDKTDNVVASGTY